MGAGQSAVVAQEHLQRWEAALNQLEQVSSNSRRMMEQDRIYGDTRLADRDDEEERRRASSLVSFNNNGANTGPTATVDIRSALASSTDGVRGPEVRTVFAGTSGPPDATTRSGGSTGHPNKHSRQQMVEMKKVRNNLFKSYAVEDVSELKDVMQCSHFGAAAVALSNLLGGDAQCRDRRKRVTVEDIFFAAQVPLHMLHSGAPHLPIMVDILRDFLAVDNRFKDEYSLEAVHLDVSPTVGEVDLGPNEVGDRQTRMQLPEFCRVLARDCEEPQVIRIVNYDPYVLEQEMLVDAYEDEDELNSPLATSVLGNPRHLKRRYSPRNDGAYAVVVDVRNAVQLMVTIAEGVVNDALHVKLTEVPAASLFKAMMTGEEGHRARGFVRVFRRDSVPEFTTDEIPQFWTPELCSGKVLGTSQLGTHITVVSHSISPHIVGVAWAMHLLAGVRPGAHGYGNGLPVSEIIRVLQFPAEVFIQGVLSLDQVYQYAQEFIIRTSRSYTVQLYPVLTNISREDAVPTISVFDLESIILDVKKSNEDPEAPSNVMLIMYNASVAHNVLYIVDDPQWCVLAGYDQEAQTVVLLDARPKTFSRTWSCPLDRLHKAMTGNGYLMFSNLGTTSPSEGASPLSLNAPSLGTSSPLDTTVNVGAPRWMSPKVQNRLRLIHHQMRLNLHQSVTKSLNKCGALRFPPLPVMPAIIAMACSGLGIATTFEEALQRLPFDVSTLINRFVTLESLHVCLDQYLHHAHLEDSVQVKVYHGEIDADGNSMLTLQDFETLIEASLKDEDRLLMVLMNGPSLLLNGASTPVGNFGLVVGYNSEWKCVSVSDCNPNSYLRTWTVTLKSLHDAITDTDATRNHRSRGCLMLYRGPREEAPMPAEYSRAFRLDLLPVQNVFHVSPSPHFQGMSLAFAQLGYFYSPEEIFYEAFLKTMNDQRRRGSQAFAWRDVDVSLSVINVKIDAAFVAQVCSKFLESRNGHRTSRTTESVEEFYRPGEAGTSTIDTTSGSSGAPFSGTPVVVEELDDIDLDDELDKLLKEATQSEDVVLLLNYDTRKAHNVAILGRSVALVKSYHPEKQLVELWDAECAVLGLSFTVSIEKLIRIGDLDNVGRSPYGFVRFQRLPGGIPPASRPALMRRPGTGDAQ